MYHIIQKFMKPNREDISIIDFNHKVYSFSINGILLFLIAGPLCSIFIYLFLEMGVNNWLKEFVASQTSFLLNLMENVDSQAIYTPSEPYPWKIYIPSIDINFYISTWCTAAHIFSIFIGFIIFIPHSKKQETKKGIILRKIKATVLLIVIVYIGNLFRLILLLGLASTGINWEVLHQIFNIISGILAAIIFIITIYKFLPEFFLSIYHLYSIINLKNNKKNKN